MDLLCGCLVVFLGYYGGERCGCSRGLVVGRGGECWYEGDPVAAGCLVGDRVGSDDLAVAVAGEEFVPGAADIVVVCGVNCVSLELDADRLGVAEGWVAQLRMAAAGAVCLQEFGKYGDFRIRRSMNGVLDDIKTKMKVEPGRMPFDAYTMLYVSQSLYQVGGKLWQDGYPLIRKALVDSQARKSKDSTSPDETHGSWGGKRVGRKPGQLFATGVAVFSLNIPNRYLPILQQGKGIRGRRSTKRAFNTPRGGKVRVAVKAGRPQDASDQAMVIAFGVQPTQLRSSSATDTVGEVKDESSPVVPTVGSRRGAP